MHYWQGNTEKPLQLQVCLVPFFSGSVEREVAQHAEVALAEGWKSRGF